MKNQLIYIALASIIASSCGTPSLPDSFTESGQAAATYPDYSDVTLPCNIAPINFMLCDSTVSNCAARISNSHGNGIVAAGSGNQIQIPESEWHKLLSESKNDSLCFDIYAMDTNSQWTRLKGFRTYISENEIDPYISYRLIEPGYSIYGDMCIAQRCLENFSESEIYSNKKVHGQCVNCHSYQNFNPGNMMFHKRAADPGTVIRTNGSEKVVNLKRDNTISAGVYPSWHPTQNLIAFSTDKTHQLFHTGNPNKVEVYDTESDLVLYNIATDEVSIIEDSKDNLEVFPTWSPCGNYLYYCSARINGGTFTGDHINDIKAIRYSILRKPFNQETMKFGQADTVYNQDINGKSSTLPRISPDGKKIIFAEGDYGCFQIWHHDSNIKMMDLETGQTDSLEALNSRDYADSYPTFSSNGKWIMIASRRDDGNYSRVYIAHFDGQRVHKPFLLPQKQASHNTMRMKSYNRPEFMKGKVE